MKNEVIETNQFERVDFDEPSSILNYGQDIVFEAEEIVANVANRIKEECIPDYDFFKRVDKLSDFSDTLDLVEEKRTKSNNLLVKFVNNVLKKDSGNRLSYNQAYQKYSENIDLLVDDVRLMYNISRQDFEVFNEFIKCIKPYVKILQNVYELGVEDKENFEKEVVELENKLLENPNDIELRREAIYKRQIIDIFSEKLYSIQKSRTAINEIVIQWNIRQVNAIKLLYSYQNFLSLEKSILKLNGTALVGAKKQKEELEMFSYLVEGVNDALKEGPKELNNVIAGVNELTKDGNIKVSTLTEIDKTLQEGVNLLKQGAAEKKTFIETSSKQLTIISEHFNEFHNDVKEQILINSGLNLEISNKALTKQKTLKSPNK